MALLETSHQTVSFGDCDPAGIVFYPNIFRWMDAAFHGAMQPFGGHPGICERLNAIGLGLIDAQASFHAPIRPGARLTVAPAVADWSDKTLTLDYRGQVSDQLCFTGREVRAIFRSGPNGIAAGDVSELRTLIEGRGNG